jgi:hypothetical protein
MLVLPAKQARVKSGNVFADTSRAQPLQSEGAAFGLSLAHDGSVIVELKSPYSDGTTHIVLSPMEFIGRLVALVPTPRVNLTRYFSFGITAYSLRIVSYARKSFPNKRYR